MRKGWTEATLGDLTSTTRRICYGVLKPGPFVEGGVPLVRITDMDRSLLGPEGMHRISSELDYEFRRSRLSGNEVLLSIQGTVGRVARCAPELAGANISRTIAVIDCDKRLMNEFLAFHLESLASSNAFNSSGSTRDSLNISEIRLINIPLPPLDEQKRIVDVVSSVDAYIDALKQQADSARKARNAVLYELLSAGGDDWTETTLGTLISLQTGKLDVNAGSEDGEFPFFTCARQIFKIDIAAFSGKSVLVAGNGDLNVKYYDGKFNAYQRTYVLQVLNEDELDVLFLFHFMDKYVEVLRGDTQGSTIQYLKKGQFVDAPINLPSLTEQKRIVEIVSSMDDVIQTTEQAVVDAKNLRSGLLSDLLSGNHEIPASYDSLLGVA